MTEQFAGNRTGGSGIPAHRLPALVGQMTQTPFAIIMASIVPAIVVDGTVIVKIG